MPGPPPYQVPQWPVPPLPGHGRSHASPSRARTGMVSELNRRRTEAGCSPVRQRASLVRAARRHSADMARHGRLTHAGSDGSSPERRMRAAGYGRGETGEVVAAGPAGARAALAEWMDSPPHRAILLTCRYTVAGAGRADGPGGPWWTLDLASVR
ncbi:CAP domain-containing protein [Streptomyces sp. NPDC007251]|uniref:CAP domain-containing protein n=1 Tax=unclassified Streptomyces TaxID=2593676 RepID=UPI00340E2B70